MHLLRDWWHSFWGAVKQDASSIWNAIYGAINNVIAWGEDWIDRIASAVDWVWRHVGAVYVFLRAIAVSVWHAIDNVWKWTTHTLFPWVGRMFADAYRWTTGAIGVVEKWVGRVAGDLLTWSRGAFSWLNSHVLVPLWRDLTGFVHWVTTTLWHLLWSWIKDLGHWTMRGLQYLWDHVASVVLWLGKHLAKWVPVFDRYAGTLLRFLLDPGTYIAHAIEELASRSARWFVQLAVSVISRETDFFVAWLERFLSL